MATLMMDIRRVFSFLTKEVVHGYVGPVITVYEEAWSRLGAKVEVRIVGTHDTWMLLCPSRFAGEPDDKVGVEPSLSSSGQHVIDSDSDVIVLPAFWGASLD